MNNFQSIANRVIDTCESTNDLAKQLAEAGYPHGTWVSTRVQQAGRGRLGRKWESLSGNLFLSMVVKEINLQFISWIPLLTATSITRYLRQKFPELKVLIKWPNDLWIQDLKFGGILCEGVGNQRQSYVVLGVGLNCVQAPQGLDQKVTDLTTALGGRVITADQIRLGLVHALKEDLSQLSHERIAQFQQDYLNWSVFSPGTWVEWGTPAQAGQVQGLGSSGELLVKLESGDPIKLYAEEVKVRKKIDNRN